MTVNQISIFLENKYGKLSEIMALLTEANIRIIAATIADTTDYGILRIIASEPQKAYKLLKESNVSANLTEVFALTIDSKTDSIPRAIDSFTTEGLSVEYMYCFSIKDESIIILRTNNQELTREVIQQKGLQHINEKELIKL